MSSTSESQQPSDSTQIAADAMLQPPPRIASAYQRTLETVGDTQPASIDLDTFDVPCPPSAPIPSARSLRLAASDGSVVTAAATEKDNGSRRARRRRKSRSGGGSGNQKLPSSSPAASPSSSTVSNVPDLGEVDLSDGKNKERPQRFKAVIHFEQPRDRGSSGRLRRGGAGAPRPPQSNGESFGESP